MESYLERMIAEKSELSIKIDKLFNFMNTDLFKELHEQKKALLKIQYRAMETYLQCLTERIKLN